MFVEDFALKAALAACPCPRGAVKGIQEATHDDALAASHGYCHIPRVPIETSVYAKCPSCGLVMEWPGCAELEPEGKSEGVRGDFAASNWIDEALRFSRRFESGLLPRRQITRRTVRWHCYTGRIGNYRK